MEKIIELELELESTMEYIDFSSLAVDTGYGRTMPFMAEVVVSCSGVTLRYVRMRTG